MARKNRPTKYRPTGVRGGYSRVVLMAMVDGYCMVRHPGCIPFTMSGAEWERLPDSPPEGVEVYE